MSESRFDDQDSAQSAFGPQRNEQARASSRRAEKVVWVLMVVVVVVAIVVVMRMA